VNAGASRRVSASVAVAKGQPVAFDIERVAAAAHHVISRAEPGKLGHVRLGTILWYADIEHYRRAGTSITGLTQYRRTAQGPFAVEITKSVGWLTRRGKVNEQPFEFPGYTRRDMISLQPPDPSALALPQTDILDHMTYVVTGLTASGLMEMIRADRLWQETKPGDAMVVATGSIVTSSPYLARGSPDVVP
jgi:hypothetical protein